MDSRIAPHSALLDVLCVASFLGCLICLASSTGPFEVSASSAPTSKTQLQSVATQNHPCNAGTQDQTIIDQNNSVSLISAIRDENGFLEVRYQLNFQSS